MSRQMSLYWVLAAMLVLATAPSVLAAGAERVPITDPEELQALGYPRDARNVYLQIQPDPGSATMTTDVSSAMRGSAPGANVGWTSSTGSEFHPALNTTEYVKGPVPLLVGNGALISSTAGAFFETQLRMPRNARWRWLDIAGIHNHTSQDLVVSAIERCLPFFVGGNATETVLASQTYGNQSGAFFQFLTVGQQIDTQLCTYHARVRLGNAGAPSAPGIQIQLSKVRAQWVPDLIFADGFGPVP